VRALMWRRGVQFIAVLALFAVVVGESTEFYGGDGQDALGLYDDEQGLGEGKEGGDFPQKPKVADKEGQEPGDGSDPPQAGGDDETKGDDMTADAEGVPEPEPPSMDNLYGKIATQKPPGPLVPKAEGEYEKIPHFKYEGTPENVKNQEECQKKCDEQKECRSYSWNDGKKSCTWSTGSLRYGHFWNFFSKEYDINAFGQMVPTKEYFRFKGLFAIDEDQNMKTIEDKSLEDCKEICNQDDKCESFSFHEGDNACLMGISKVEYMKGWNYYERNRPPKALGGKWRPYPQRLDSYHKALREREKKSLGIFAERDQKIRVKTSRKERKTKKVSKATERRKKRLDQEMKQKEFAGEQQRKKAVLAAKQKKVDLEAAQERGKFDEAFHKQAEINKELIKKKNMEQSVKGSMVARIHEKDRKENKKLEKKLADIKDRSMKELAQKQKETESKERLQKNTRKARAVDMKNEAFKLVKEERKYKAYEGFRGTKKAATNYAEKLLHKKWVAEDKEQKYTGMEKEVKRQIKVEKMSHEVHRKLIKEKEEKGPPPTGSGQSIPKEKTVLPPPPPPFKSPPIPEKTPGRL